MESMPPAVQTMHASRDMKTKLIITAFVAFGIEPSAWQCWNLLGMGIYWLCQAAANELEWVIRHRS